MSGGASVAYRLRPNKAVDRELFLSLLGRLGAQLRLERYAYVGLGGPFLEDFRLVHARIGIDRMVCIESEEAVHRRQSFNRPIESIECVHAKLEEYLESTEFEVPVVLWLDFTEPKTVVSQIETFARQTCELPINSIVRVTLNANPTSLGKPPAKNLAVALPGEEKAGGAETELEWRLARFKERLGGNAPAGLIPDAMTHRNYGGSLLEALRLCAEREILDHPERKLVWALATHYSDGQAMVTATAVVVADGDEQVGAIVAEWPYASTPQEPLRLDLPALSTIERLTMESTTDPKARMGYDLPVSDMGEDPFEAFRRFYRVFPHFARVDF
jgi:hypothetical protein